MDCVNNAVFGRECGDSLKLLTQWRSHERKLLVNHLRSGPKPDIHGNSHFSLFLTCFAGGKTQKNRWKRYLTLVVHGGSITRDIVTSRKLWRHFDRLSWERFVVGLVRLPAVVKLIITLNYHGVFTNELSILDIEMTQAMWIFIHGTLLS